MMRSRSHGLLPITSSGNFARYDTHGTGLHKLRKKAGSGTALQRLLTYLALVTLLGGSIYGVTRAGSMKGGASTSIDDFVIHDELLDSARFGATADAAAGGAAAAGMYDKLGHAGGDLVGGGIGDGGAAGTMQGVHDLHQQQQQPRQQQHHVHGLHDMHDTWHDELPELDRRSAMEQQGGGGGGEHEEQQQHPHTAAEQEEEEQQHLEEQHVEELQHLEQQHHLEGHDHGQQQQQQHDEQQHRDAGQQQQEEPEAVSESVAAHIAEQQAMPRREGPSLYAANLSAVDIRGHVLRTGDLAGKVTVMVNVASQCGFTDANYKGLQRLYDRYADYGLEVLAFPCNQFGEQEPSSNAVIEQFAKQRYGVKFPLMSKVEVNGGGQHPIFAWLKAHTPAAAGHHEGDDDVGWNFEKWLLDKHGNLVKHYGSDMVYHDLELDVYNELVKY